MILAGDVGGTNARLGLVEVGDGERLRLAAARTFPSREHASLEEIVEAFRADHPLPVDRACFAVAGPVSEGRVPTTNLPWIVDAERLARAAGVRAVSLLNDLEAIGYGLPELDAADLATLNEGDPTARGNLAVIAAGTGLGEASCYWDGEAHRPFASEGGHADFAPRNALEWELLRYLLGKFERVSYERVVSGAGLVEVYRFLHHTGRGREPEALTEVLYQQAHPAPIVRAALEERSERCAQALDLFVSLYGAEAGNLALKVMARGGVFLGGGIAPKILSRLREPGFMAAFTAKGRMRPLLEAMPVRVILNDRAGLLGAARFVAPRRPARRAGRREPDGGPGPAGGAGGRG
jgi:glucokinase